MADEFPAGPNCAGSGRVNFAIHDQNVAIRLPGHATVVAIMLVFLRDLLEVQFVMLAWFIGLQSHCGYNQSKMTS